MAPDSPDTDILDLDRRAGLPAEWLYLCERHPRARWPGHAGLGMTAQFWLDRHDGFRRLGAALDQATQRFLGGGQQADDFQGWFVPRLQMLLGELHGHHQVEDHHYFPVFRRMEPGLAAGFELLDRDHKLLHADLYATADAANAFLQALARSPQDAEAPGAAYAETSTRLLNRMLRHLDDEEDLVIPLLIERGESGLMG